MVTKLAPYVSIALVWCNIASVIHAHVTHERAHAATKLEVARSNALSVVMAQQLHHTPMLSNADVSIVQLMLDGDKISSLRQLGVSIAQCCINHLHPCYARIR